ncbi:MAG: RDD family protein [Moorellales bacterium]
MEVCGICGRAVEPGSRACRVCGAVLGSSGLVLASPGKRLGAALVEGVIGVLVSLLLEYGVAARSPAVLLAGLAGGVVFLVWTVLLWREGRSVGKRFLGLRVCTVEGRRVGFGTMLLREVVGKFISSVVVYLGYLWVLFDRDRQGWHDKIAGTLVVDERLGSPEVGPLRC